MGFPIPAVRKTRSNRRASLSESSTIRISDIYSGSKCVPKNLTKHWMEAWGTYPRRGFVEAVPAVLAGRLSTQVLPHRRLNQRSALGLKGAQLKQGDSHLSETWVMPFVPRGNTVTLSKIEVVS